MLLFRKPLHQRRPILDAVIGDPLEANVRSRTEKTLLQILTESVVDGEGDDERSHSGGDSDDGDTGDDPDECLTALGAEIAGRDKEFESHEAFSCQRSAFSQFGL